MMLRREGGGGVPWRRHGDITCVKKKRKKQARSQDFLKGGYVDV